MSELGQTEKNSVLAYVFRVTLKADIAQYSRHVSNVPFPIHAAAKRHARLHGYSITSSARASNVGGTVRPSAFAVLRLTTISNLVANSTGRSAGLAPLRILTT